MTRLVKIAFVMLCTITFGIATADSLTANNGGAQPETIKQADGPAKACKCKMSKHRRKGADKTSAASSENADAAKTQPN